MNKLLIRVTRYSLLLLLVISSPIFADARNGFYFTGGMYGQSITSVYDPTTTTNINKNVVGYGFGVGGELLAGMDNGRVAFEVDYTTAGKGKIVPAIMTLGLREANKKDDKGFFFGGINLGYVYFDLPEESQSFSTFLTGFTVGRQIPIGKDNAINVEIGSNFGNSMNITGKQYFLKGSFVWKK